MLGHIVSVKNNGSKNIENFLPICKTCNRSMGETLFFKYQRENGYEVNKEIENLFKEKPELFYEKTDN